MHLKMSEKILKMFIFRRYNKLLLLDNVRICTIQMNALSKKTRSKAVAIIMPNQTDHQIQGGRRAGQQNEQPKDKLKRIMCFEQIR